ncbi:protein-glutamine gamma-glutamyltransferase 5-like isoform X2 [Nelusetta ayraudi]|uniref:protein-glutamine gamma-glutamyltransferase 5-like isoform X2 n=1 Tax=Nelusetta ayraudi TaxID=303726 RepID=UPI003F71505F
MQPTAHYTRGLIENQCRLKYVNFETHFNHIYHETLGFSREHLVVRRGKPFRLTLMFDGRSWNPQTEILGLRIWLGNFSQWFPVQAAKQPSNPESWSAKIHPGDLHGQSLLVHICSPVRSSVGAYGLEVTIETAGNRRSYAVGTLVVLCNPWLEEDPVYLPAEEQREEYVRSDYGLVYMGSNLNPSGRPWSFGQYEPGVLEACLKLLQVSPQHLSDVNQDYILRADPVYLCRVICAMVNCNDDQGILAGKWHGSYQGGVNPTEWSCSSDILQSWALSDCSPVRYGQCWVFAAVLCTVMRALGVPSRVVTVFNAAHDTDGSLNIEEYYTSRGQKLSLSKDSVWNFHVWTECWMRRLDLGPEFDGWQVVDPTPQEKSAGVFCCGPCPVGAIRRRHLTARFDAPFVYASVDANIVRRVVSHGRVVGTAVDTESVGSFICTKSVDSDAAENLTPAYKSLQSHRGRQGNGPNMLTTKGYKSAYYSSPGPAADASGGLEVSLTLDGVPSMVDSIAMCVVVRNGSTSPRLLVQHLNAQLKKFNGVAQDCFWETQQEVQIMPGEVLKLRHRIPPSAYQSFLADDDIVNVAAVIKDLATKHRVLATQEFSLSSPQISMEIEGGSSIQMNKEHTAHVSFTNTFGKTLSGATLTVEGSGLFHGKHEARVVLLPPGKTMQKNISITAYSPGTKLLMATFSHSGCQATVSRSFHKISVSAGCL